MRIVSWNVENIAPRLGDRLRDELAALDGDLICLQELKLRPVDRAAVDAMAAALPTHELHVALADDPLNVRFRGGRAYGVATYVRRTLGPIEASTPAWDREGRVVVTALPAHALTIINLYAVNGTGKPYYDEHGRLAGDRHARKRWVQEQIFELGRQAQARGDHLIMIGDWNVSRTAADIHPRLRTEVPHALARTALNDELIPALDVVDAFRELHPDARAYTWFNPRSRALDAARVDYALVSRALMPHVRAATIDERPTARPGSDHAPLTLELAYGSPPLPA